MSKEKDFCAFPQSQEEWGGIMARDYFAARAPISIEDARNAMQGVETPSWEEIFAYHAQMRYAYADAMLEARVK